jgi:hypothetical protein
VEHSHYPIWWDTVILNLVGHSHSQFGGTQSLPNLVEHSHSRVVGRRLCKYWSHLILIPDLQLVLHSANQKNVVRQWLLIWLCQLLNLLRKGNHISFGNKAFSIWWNTTISQFCGTESFSIWWDTVITQFGGTQSFSIW